MVVSAITAPKAKGIDNIVVAIIHEKDELEKLAKKMEELAESYGEFFRRDADNIRRSQAVVLIGCKIIDIGVKKPNEYKYDVNLVLSLINLGIAIGSAVKTASIHNVDNRIMYTVGVAAKNLRLIDADVIIGIPLSATSKNIYFDRKWK
ncbi:ferredoxin [Desulfurococcaceae archaeon MEX13E-LK6-19]|nr:ferredoxin [Desulfurococcaceae archaeon MEX13E-LK6-19]